MDIAPVLPDFEVQHAALTADRGFSGVRASWYRRSDAGIVEEQQAHEAAARRP